jgi:hypothetical protein
MIKLEKIIIILMAFILFLSSYSISASNEKEVSNEIIELKYYFETPIIKQVRIGNKTYDQVNMNDVTCFGNSGEPNLPIKGAYILLPPDSRIRKITASFDKKISVGKNLMIAPVPEIIPKYQSININHPNLNWDIYNSSNLFPNEIYREIGVYKFRGYDILVLSLHPIQYKPDSGELFFIQVLNLKIEMQSYYDKNSLFRGLNKDEFQILKKVDNPEMINKYRESSSIYTNFLEKEHLLILTVDNLADDFDLLVKAHFNRGIQTSIKTLNDISIFPDQLNPEDVREFIRQEYLQNGIDYVLIGGDIELIPAKYLYVFGLDEETWPYETEMPCDLFYSCLDGTFNYDGDSRWGEPSDGENGNDVDLFAEVFVGRACVDDKEDVDNFVNKTIKYMNAEYEDEYIDNILLAGEYLGDHGIASWGGNYLDLLIDECNLDGYKTNGIPSNRYEIEKLYDRDQEWNKLKIIEAINEDIHILNHDGHSNYYYSLKMVNDDVVYLNNNKPCFIYSVGCNCGGFDYEDCFAETINVKTSFGAFAVIMNARYGWFWSQSTDGDSTRYTREFWDAVFDENITVISRANQDSKEDNLFLIERSCMRWCYYQLHLFGDPSLSFHISSSPDTPGKPSGPSSIKKGDEAFFQVSTIDLEDDGVFFLFDWGDGADSGWIGPFKSGEICETMHIWNKIGEYNVRVIARDSLYATSEWSEPLNIKIEKKVKLLDQLLIILDHFLILPRYI